MAELRNRESIDSCADVVPSEPRAQWMNHHLLMLGSSKIVAFIPVTNTSRAKAFYVDLLGLALVDDTPFALVCDADGTTVRITPVGDLSPQPFTVFGWAVDDIAAMSSALSSAGVELLRFDGLEHDVFGVWTAPGGDRIAWFHDPDGNILSLSQHAPASASQSG